MTLRTLNYGNYGIFLIMGIAGFCPSTVWSSEYRVDPKPFTLNPNRPYTLDPKPRATGYRVQAYDFSLAQEMLGRQDPTWRFMGGICGL